MAPKNKKSEEKWLAQRQKGIGGSEAAAVLGLSPWITRYQLWAHKTGLSPLTPPSGEFIRWGTLLEPVIRDYYAETTGRKVWQDSPYTVLHHEKYPFILGSLDGWVEDERLGRGVLEIKTANAWAKDDWAAEPPLPYLIQGMHYLAITGAPYISFGVLLGGNQFKYIDVLRDDNFINLLIKEEVSFWLSVVEGQEPAIDGHAGTARALAGVYGHDDGESVVLPSESLEWDARRLECAEKVAALKAEVKGLEYEKGEIENTIRQFIGTAAAGEMPDGSGSYTWKSRKRGKTDMRVLRRVKVKG